MKLIDKIGLDKMALKSKIEAAINWKIGLYIKTDSI